MSICATAEHPHRQQSGVTRRYFYVPKGTKWVIAYAYAISNTQFFTASGTLKHTQPYVGSGGADIQIPVAPGEDDQIWYVGATGYTFWCQDFFFQNIPGLLAANADELLIPKDAYANLLPSGATASTRGNFQYMYGVNAFYLRGNAAGTLPTINIRNGVVSQTKGNGTWTLYTEDGKTALESGIVLPDNISRPVTFTTTGQDTFLFVYDDKGAYSTLTWDAGKAVAICANRLYDHTQHGGVSRRYFFVPKGATRVDFHATSIASTKFFTANGTLKYTQPRVDNVGVDTSIPVGPGEDDQIWYIGAPGYTFWAKDLTFWNLPGHLAASPDELLIPQWTFSD